MNDGHTLEQICGTIFTKVFPIGFDNDSANASSIRKS